MLRSGAYSDEVVTNLVRRRFVAVMYDVAPPDRNAGDGWAYDKDAVAAIGSIRALRKQSTKPAGASQGGDGRVRAGSYPAAVFLLPDGTRLGPVQWGILPPEEMLAVMRGVMAQWPQHFAATAEEKAALRAAEERPDDPAAQLAAARLQWELAEFEAVVAHASDAIVKEAPAAVAAELRYLRTRALICLGRDAEAAAALAGLAPKGVDLADAVIVARARLAMRARKFDEALELLLPLTEYDEPRRWSGTAMYYAGLCHHSVGSEEKAKALWRRHRAELPFDRLARRSAGSLGLPEAEAFLNQELLETKGWW